MNETMQDRMKELTPAQEEALEKVTGGTDLTPEQVKLIVDFMFENCFYKNCQLENMRACPYSSKEAAYLAEGGGTCSKLVH